MHSLRLCAIDASHWLIIPSSRQKPTRVGRPSYRWLRTSKRTEHSILRTAYYKLIKHSQRHPRTPNSRPSAGQKPSAACTIVGHTGLYTIEYSFWYPRYDCQYAMLLLHKKESTAWWQKVKPYFMILDTNCAVDRLACAINGRERCVMSRTGNTLPRAWCWVREPKGVHLESYYGRKGQRWVKVNSTITQNNITVGYSLLDALELVKHLSVK